MRMAFIESLCKIALQDKRIWLLTGDLGYSVLEPFANSFPERFINAGIAEQNMTGVSAGLALSGKIVFTYSIANFPILRCLEQIRNDICYHNLNVKIVSVGGGVAYGTAGYSHHATEDLAIMRVLPNITVLAPGDPIEVRLAMQAAVTMQGPCYLRLGKGGEPVQHRITPHFAIGKPITIREGRDVTILSTGGILNDVVTAADELTKKGWSVSVASMHTLKPLDEIFLLSLCQKTKFVVTVEEHGPGGLASIIAEIIACSGIPIKFHPFMLKPETFATTGDQKYLRSAGDITAGNIVDHVIRLLDPPR